MTEQQYTCPKCFKNYTRFTISEHYGCGVEPLEMAKQQTNEDEVGSNLEAKSKASLPSEQDIGEVATSQEAAAPQTKKRGPKPKVKTVA